MELNKFEYRKRTRDVAIFDYIFSEEEEEKDDDDEDIISCEYITVV